jgi:hypothetical protein
VPAVSSILTNVPMFVFPFNPEISPGAMNIALSHLKSGNKLRAIVIYLFDTV